MTNKEDLQSVIMDWIDQKEKESLARAKRVEIEANLIKLAGFSKIEGSQTINQGNFKITFSAKLDKKLDELAYAEIAHLIKEEHRPVRYKAELDALGMKWVKDNDPNAYDLMTRCIVVKPAKVSVNILPIDGEKNGN